MTELFLDLLNLLDCAYLARRFDRIYVVADNYIIHKATAVRRWLEQHPRFNCCFCLLIVFVLIPSSAASAICTTKSPATIDANGCAIWSKTYDGIWPRTAHGHTGSAKFITQPR
ncbi:MAG: hypothetical protein JO185_08085 [Acidobacteriaceae bacterium]|nr:hypothetical protein [Acidobacteriaceae bacterium]